MKKYRKRVVDDLLARKLLGMGAVLVQGAKWCGKTTTCEEFAKSALYMADPDTKESNLQMADIYDLILSKRCLDFTSPHIACMTIGPKKRNLDINSKNAKDRYIVCIRWNFIKEDILEFKKCMGHQG